MLSTYRKRAIYVILITYFIANLFFLTNYPFIHSDESWLSGLSRNMLEKRDLSVTETFFDLYPRNPHAIKTIFHLIQILFIKGLGYSIFTVRLISLITGTISLYLFYKLSLLLFKSKKLSLLAAVLLGLDIQYIYASHFARQEIILVFILILGLYFFYNKLTFGYNHKQGKGRISPHITLGVIIGLGAGIHPNSFIIALPYIFIYLYHLLATKKIKVRSFLAFSLTLVVFAFFFIILSLSFDPDFLQHYSQYGKKLGVLNPLSAKMKQLVYFYLKLFYGVSGTYYTPNIRFQFFLFGAVLFLSLGRVILVKKENNRELSLALLLSILAINTGYILIGRYNQTSIVFLFPLFYLLTIDLITNWPSAINYRINSLIARKIKGILFTGLILTLAVNTVLNLYTSSYDNYDDYLKDIATVVSRDAEVLANLNCEYYFANGKLHDYRNLGELKKHGLSFREYIIRNKIEYIIYPEEMDFIYNTRPVWNVLYGNLAYYYQEMQDFFQNNCLLIHEFENETYGMRIARYIGKKNWKIKIYKVVSY